MVWLRQNPDHILSTTREWLLFYFGTAWLFTYSDMKTIVFPQSIFGASTAYAACLFEQPLVAPHETPSLLLARYSLAIVWTWSNLLPFDICNQLSQEAIDEDRINKPWRPLPSGRINRKNALYMMYTHYILAILISIGLGGLRQSLLLILLGAWYNIGGGANNNFVTRNFINAAGILSFASGAMEVVLGFPLVVTKPSVEWLGILALVIFSTIQMQDLPDIEGDSDRNRKTMPLVVGNTITRWVTAILVLVFSGLPPTYWRLDWYSFIVPLLLGTLVATRVTFLAWL
ncbi:UbiA prenyltransferase family-domain-containing protein [Hypoxylon trugodes]|uniref:UbiA prenyltransferase family-domain-containing protein n=1 Tax=Hypoxylon trugodes TaxID=326681 RepID=UPI0021A08D64|nr:UbiA prenyltransferase family-domain-containing protein [Hypoxylon trugodes]KAI1387695.1 UbiA prenyltransferase family-domain-containing protein [Hypoxylon trugodes]